MKQLGQIKIGRYQIQRHLVRGGMADIYLAHDSEEDRIVAIKMVHESAGEYCERFQREARVMIGLIHEHILPVFDYGEHESWYFLVTPYIQYGTLNGRLDAGPLTLEEVDPILAQLTEALQFAHEQGIVHRDVKPSNVLMHEGHHVYLADFGLVKRVGQENGLTVTGYLIGTPEYMAPELAEEDATPQSDVYALGVLLYQMLTGRVPFIGNTPMGTFLHHIRDTPEPPSTLNAAIPAEVEAVILHALEKDPQDRYQSAQELYLAYQQATKSVVVGHEVVVPALPVAKRLATVGIIDISRGEQDGTARRSLIVAALATVFILTLGFVLVSSVFFLGGWGNGTHAVNAQDARDRNVSPSAAKHTTPGYPADSTTDKRSADGIATGSASTTNLYQYPGSSQQNIPAQDKSVQSGASIGSSMQGTTVAAGGGNSASGSTGIGDGSSVGSGDGQSTGSGGNPVNGSGSGQAPSGGNGSGNRGGGGGGHDRGGWGGNGGEGTSQNNGAARGTGSGTPAASGTGSGTPAASGTGSGTPAATPAASGTGTPAATPAASGTGTPAASGQGTGGH